MKRAVLLLAFLLVCTFAIEAFAQGTTYVNPYTRKDGTQVQGHYRTTPDNNPYNNWSTRGNVNPYTGQPGYKNPNGTSNYGTGNLYNPYQQPQNRW